MSVAQESRVAAPRILKPRGGPPAGLRGGRQRSRAYGFSPVAEAESPIKIGMPDQEAPVAGAALADARPIPTQGLWPLRGSLPR